MWTDILPSTLMELAKQCRELYLKVSAEDANLYGLSLLDLMADNFEASTVDLMSAIIVAGIFPIANERIQQQIRRYR